MILAAATGPSSFWFVTRGTGAIALVLLTLSIALGVVNVRRTRIGEMPRFVLDSVHRSASLLAVTFLAVHVATALMDGFAPIALLDVVIPFGSAYRPVWLGLGAVAFDLMVAITITSLLRRRLGYGAWRATHWLAYASWPVALLHGLGTGTDTKTHWMLVLTAGCVAVMLTAVLTRVSTGWPHHLAARMCALAAAALVPVALLAWLPSGPLAAGWAKRAGTPATLVASVHVAPAGSSSIGSAGRVVSTRAPGGKFFSSSTTSFSAATDGRVRQVQVSDRLTLVDISLTIHRQALSNLHIRIRGEPITGGGVQMSSSRVTLGPVSNPDQYSGRVTALQGTRIAASVSGASGSAVSVLARLHISPGLGTVTGSVTANPGGGTP